MGLEYWTIDCGGHHNTYIPKFRKIFTVFEKKSLKVFATSVSLDSILSLLTKIIVSLDLTFSERKGLTVCQNFLLSVISFSFNLAAYSFFLFSEGRNSSFFVCYRVLCLICSLRIYILKRLFNV